MSEASLPAHARLQMAEELVQSLLKKLRLQKVACTLLYATAGDNGQPVARVVSNSDEKGTQAALAWMKKIDPSVVGAAARSLHESGRCSICGLASRYIDLPSEVQERHLKLAQAALDAAREAAGIRALDD